MLNILLVEDDEFFRAAVKNILLEQGWKITEAPDGRAARDVIKVAAPFDMVLSDIQMPHLTGVELLQWVKANKPMPFVLMTGFALIMETKRAHELGADDFLAKPFETGEILEIARRICAEKIKANSAPELARRPPSEFCKVSIEEFVAAKTLNFDVYVQLGSRFVKIGRKGDQIPVDRIQAYSSKGLKHLHVKKDDFRQLVSFNLSLAKTVAAADKLGLEKKANFMRYTGEVLLEKAFIAGVDNESYTEAKEFLATSMDVLTDEPNALNLIESLNSHSDYIYAHSLCVSIYSVMIAKQMGWTSTQNLFKLSLSGIFHDIGKKEIERELLDKPRPMLTHAERHLIESHCLRGKEILLALRTMPSEVVAVAYEHHEDNLGTGYPRGIDKLAIHPFAQIIRVADLFAGFTLKSPHSDGMTPEKAIEHLNIHYRESVSQDAFLALCRLFDHGLQHFVGKAA